MKKEIRRTAAKIAAITMCAALTFTSLPALSGIPPFDSEVTVSAGGSEHKTMEDAIDEEVDDDIFFLILMTEMLLTSVQKKI